MEYIKAREIPSLIWVNTLDLLNEYNSSPTAFILTNLYNFNGSKLTN